MPLLIVLSLLSNSIPRQPEFIVRCTVAKIAVDGIGPKKRDAKRAAALKALQQLEIVSINDEQPDNATKSLAPNDYSEFQSTSKGKCKHF